MKYFNTDSINETFIKLWEDSNDEEQSTDNDYEPDDDRAFWDDFYDGI